MPAPPPLAGVVLDGSNVLATNGRGGLERIESALVWFADRVPDWPQMVFLDAATARRLRPEVQDVVRARCTDVTPGRARWAVSPPDLEADLHVLEFARGHRALIVSNDRFFDYDELRRDVITVQFRFVAGGFEPFDEATWFRGSGGAQRVGLGDLLGS
ncbi:MAG: hypothetical protein NXI31_19415 [bacterium]|nr:hypothetical protein [bacterium]